jgi:hypothetical protein
MNAPLRDLIAALLLIVLGIAGILSTFDFPDRAAAWPRWMWGALVAFSLLLLIDAAKGLRRRGSK